jgi:hypothetical protein
MRALALLGAAMVLAGCGSDATREEDKAAEANAKVDELLETEGPLAGLGEASPPPSDDAQWETDRPVGRLSRSRSVRSATRPSCSIDA